MAPGHDSPLALDAESMRRIGYRTVDMLVDRLTGPAGPALVLDWVLVNRLMKDVPDFAARLERASRERLARL